VADVFTPLRTEAVIESETGRFTVRYADYFDELSSASNATGTNIDGQVQALLTTIQQTQSFTSEMNKLISENAQLISSVNQMRSNIAELNKSIEKNEQLIAALNLPTSKFSEIDKELAELRGLIAHGG
jgi:flagellar hook-associated protein FlgK